MGDPLGPVPLRAIWCGQVAFDQALEAQETLRSQVVEDHACATMLLCEHPPSLTMGRRAKPEHLLWGPEMRAQHQLSVFETPRGGEATLHAPGQLVVYPVCYVGKRIRAHIQNLADAAVGILNSAGIQGAAMDWEHPGVWLEGQKFASIGVHVSRGVAIQGLSFNVVVQEVLFGALVSCGMPTVKMASWWPLRDASGGEASWVSHDQPPMDELARDFGERFAKLAGFELSWDSDPKTLADLGFESVQSG